MFAGGGGGNIGANDTTTVTYSEDMDASTFCSTWSNDGTNQTGTGTVELTASATNSVFQNLTHHRLHDALRLDRDEQVLGHGLDTDVHRLGDVEPDGEHADDHVHEHRHGRHRVTGVAAAVPSYTADTALTDLSGNAIGAGPYAGTSSRW